MRLIHTSDWHLGQYFFTKSRAAEHQAFLRWLIEQVEQQRVDALIVAGDLFDTGSPPATPVNCTTALWWSCNAPAANWWC